MKLPDFLKLGNPFERLSPGNTFRSLHRLSEPFLSNGFEQIVDRACFECLNRKLIVRSDHDDHRHVGAVLEIAHDI